MMSNFARTLPVVGRWLWDDQTLFVQGSYADAIDGYIGNEGISHRSLKYESVRPERKADRG